MRHLPRKHDKMQAYTPYLLHTQLSLHRQTGRRTDKQQTSSGPSERLVGGGGDHMGVLKGASYHLGCYQTRCVGHVCHQISTDIVGGLTHTGVVVIPGIC